MEYLTTQQTAEKWNVTTRWVQALIKRGSIEGAIRFGNVWMIPQEATKPVDKRWKINRQPQNEIEEK